MRRSVAARRKKGLGRLPSADRGQLEAYPISAVLPRAVEHVEKQLDIAFPPSVSDQGVEGSCVGFGSSRMDTVLKCASRAVRQLFAARWLYHAAQALDPWAGQPHEGTTVHAAMRVLQQQGHVPASDMGQSTGTPDIDWGIGEYRWATTTDEMRTAIAAGVPISVGIDWYGGFDDPKQDDHGDTVIRRGRSRLRGGHCVCIVGASDAKQAFAFVNSWGDSYPFPVYLPYDEMQFLLDNGGEAAIVTDKLIVPTPTPLPTPTPPPPGPIPTPPPTPGPVPTSVRVTCPHCHVHLIVAMYGKRERRVRCPHCHAHLIVTLPASTPSRR
jgi:hypothetical protein